MLGAICRSERSTDRAALLEDLLKIYFSRSHRSIDRATNRNGFARSIDGCANSRSSNSAARSVDRSDWQIAPNIYTSSNVCHSHEWRVDTASGKTLKKRNACLHAVRPAVAKKIACIYGLRSEWVKDTSTTVAARIQAHILPSQVPIYSWVEWSSYGILLKGHKHHGRCQDSTPTFWPDSATATQFTCEFLGWSLLLGGHTDRSEDGSELGGDGVEQKLAVAIHWLAGTAGSHSVLTDKR